MKLLCLCHRRLRGRGARLLDFGFQKRVDWMTIGKRNFRSGMLRRPCSSLLMTLLPERILRRGRRTSSLIVKRSQLDFLSDKRRRDIVIVQQNLLPPVDGIGQKGE